MNEAFRSSLRSDARTNIVQTLFDKNVEAIFGSLVIGKPSIGT